MLAFEPGSKEEGQSLKKILICFTLFFFRNNYNMLLTPQFEPFFSNLSSTLYTEKCQSSYETFSSFVLLKSTHLITFKGKVQISEGIVLGK